MLVRYNGNGDDYIPVQLVSGGEMHYTKGVPDMILNFHKDTHAITVTICNIQKNKLPDYEIAMQTLYSMVINTEPEKMLSVQDFTTMYDLKRYEILRLTSFKTSFKPQNR